MVSLYEQKTPHQIRYHALDVFKFIGIFGIIILHSEQLFSDINNPVYVLLNLISRVVVPVYFMISGFFLERAIEFALSLDALWMKYVRRLGIPFVAWSLFYLFMPKNWPALFFDGHAYKDLVDKLHQFYVQSFGSGFSINFLLSGGRFHLWYLETLLICVSISVLARNVRPMFWEALLLFIVFYFGNAWFWAAKGHGLEFIAAGPFVGFLYLQAGRLAYKYRDALPKTSLCLWIALAGFALQITEANFLYSHYGMVMRNIYSGLMGTTLYAGGFFLFLLSLRDRPVPQILSYCGRYSLGMYALHVFILDAVTNSVEISPFGARVMFLMVFVFIMTIVTTLILSRVRVLKPILS